jgi:hypothetical protein
MNVVLVSSSGQCGVYECAQILLGGFIAAGHRARYIGVKNWDDADLFRQLRQISPDDDVVIFEYEPGIFHLRALVRAMAHVRFVRRKKVMLSVHEIEPSKYPAYHHIQWRLNQHARFRGPLEIMRLAGATVDLALHFFSMRLFLDLLGWLPHMIVVHSQKVNDNSGLILADRSKVVEIPLAIKSLDGDIAALRAELGLRSDRFLLISPGFLFRRKRIIETIQQLPEGVELLIVGVPSEYDPGYLEEIQSYLAEHPTNAVRLVPDYNVEPYVLASDAVVLYYREIFQSAVAGLAAGAGKPCIFSNLPGFDCFKEAGLFVKTPLEFHQAMIDIQDPTIYARLKAGALRVRDELSPAHIAQAHVDALSSRGESGVSNS